MNRDSAFKSFTGRVRTDLAVALLALLFFVLPLFRSSALEDSFISPKLALAQIFTLAALLVLLARSVRSGAEAFSGRAVGALLLGFLAISALTTGFARSPALSLHALAYFATFFVLYFVCAGGLRELRDLWILFGCGIAAAVLTAAWTLAEDATHGNLPGRLVPRLPDWRGHLAAGLGNSGHIAGYIGMFLPAAILCFLAAERFRAGLFACICLMFAALVVTWSIGSTGATILALALWTIPLVRRDMRGNFRWRRVWALVGAGIAVMLFYFLPHPLNPHNPSLLKEAFGSARWAEGGPTRVAIWSTTAHMIMSQPVFGIGIGNFTLEYVREIVPWLIADPKLNVYAGAFTNDAHNEYLQVWAEGGFASLVLYLGVFVAFFAKAHNEFERIQRPAERILLIAATSGATVFVFDSLMSFPLRLPSHIAALMFLLAVPEVVARCAPASTPLSPVPPGRPRLTMSVAMCFALFCVGTAGLLVHSQRVVAQYHFKQGRALAESAIMLPAGIRTSAWQAADTTFSNGAQMLAAGDKAGAEKAFQAAREIAQSHPLMLAETFFRRALAWDPRYSNASSRYGALLMMRGNYADAVRTLKTTLLDLQSHEIHERLGFAYYFSGDMKSAAREWSVCQERRPVLAGYFRGLVRQTQP